VASCSIIVPTYDAAALLSTCLDALIASIGDLHDVEILVSDDGSHDATPEVVARFVVNSGHPSGPHSRRRHTTVRWVRSAHNSGFATACNAAAEIATGTYLIFYNNDLVAHPGWLEELVAYADADLRRAIVGTRLLFPDGHLQHCGVVVCSDGFPRHVYAGFPGDHSVAMRSGPVGIVTAACVLVRREVYQALGGFDQRYVNGYEDVDLCLRAQEAGHEVHYCHSSVLTHLVSATRRGRHDEFERSENAFLARWGRLPPTDVVRFVEDGMLTLSYSRTFPLHLSVAPELAVVSSDRDGTRAVISDLRNLVDRLRLENVRLRMRPGR